MAKRRNQNGAAANGAMQPSEAKAAYFLSLTVRNIRCFGDEPQTLDLSNGNGQPANWTVLLGINGTGKTTLLQAIAGTGCVPYGHDATGWPVYFTWRNAHYLNHDSAYFLREAAEDGSVKIETALGPVLNAEDRSYEKREIIWDETHKTSRITGQLQHLPFLNCYGYGASRRFSLMGLRQTELLHDATASLFSDDANVRNAEDWLLSLDYSASKESVFQEQQKRQRNLVTKLLIKILPDVDDFRFIAGEGTHPKPRVEAQTPYGWVALRQLGHGYRTLIAWMVDLVSRLVERYPDSPNPLEGPAVVLVDEIDLHMHPLWQRKLMGELTKSFPNTQFIVTAHSPLIVQAAAENANIALLRREGDHVVIDNDVGYIRGWDISMLLTSELFGLPSARPPQYDAVFERRQALLGKSKRTAKEEAELAKLNEQVFQLPYGETAEQAKTSLLIQESLELLKQESTATAMIRVTRPAFVPSVLRNQGVLATQTLCAAYEASPAAYTKGTMTFADFDPKIYCHAEVKRALRQAQHDKCCFCESIVTHIAFGDVEHFRPKKAFRTRPGGPLIRPGYFWLAYEWTNLFFCCQLCNQRFKQNLFPLKNPRRRARSHLDNLADEQPLFINPEEDPSAYLRFQGEIAVPYRKSKRGQATIAALGLNRPELVRMRLNSLNNIQVLMASKVLFARVLRQARIRNDEPSPGCADQIVKIDERLAELSSDSAEYAAMVRAAMASDLPPT